MSNQRKDGKKKVNFWATEEEKQLLEHAAKAAGFETLTDYLRWVGREQPRPGELPDDVKRP